MPETIEHAEQLGSSPESPFQWVRCSCGATNQFMKEGWAKHGEAKCSHCRRWIAHVTLEVSAITDPVEVRVVTPEPDYSRVVRVKP
jgi:hypothetical protein